MLSRGNSDSAARLRRAKSTSSVPLPSSRPPLPSSNDDISSTYNHAKTAAARAFEKYNQSARPHNQRHLKKTRRSLLRTKPVSAPGSHFARQRSNASSRQSRPSTSESNDPIGWKASDRASMSAGGVVVAHARSVGSDDLRSRFSEPDSIHNHRFLGAERSMLSKIGLMPESRLSPKRGTSIQTNAATVVHTPIRCNDDCNASAYHSGQHGSRDEVVAAARDRFLQEHQPRVLGRRRSFIPASFSVFSKKSQNRSMDEHRSVSTGIIEVTNHTPLHSQQSRLSLSGKAKRVSKSFTKRLRRAFDRSSDKQASLPAQQVDARQSHFGKSSFSGFSGSYGPADLLPEIERVPSLDDETTTADFGVVDSRVMQSYLASEESRLCVSEILHPGRSRVTSWNDSSGNNTINVKESTQLTVIEENADSYRRFPISRSQEGPKSAGKRGSKSSMRDATDVKRLFSAVRRRLERDSFNDASLDEFDIVVHPSSAELAHCASNASDEKPSDASPTVKLLPVVSFNSDLRHAGVCTNQREPHTSRHDTVISPSIYSFQAEAEPGLSRSTHDDSSSFKQTIPGTALVESRSSVAKWSLQDHSLSGSAKPVLTSNEWRQWANGEISELDKDVLLTNLDFESIHSSQEEPRHVREEAQIDEPDKLAEPGRSVDSRKTAKVTYRPKLGTWTATYMNDRFPMLDTSRKSSSRSLSSLRQNASDQGSGSSRHSSSRSLQKPQKHMKIGIASNERHKLERSAICEEIPLRTSPTQATSQVANDTFQQQHLNPPAKVQSEVDEPVLSLRNNNNPTLPQNHPKYRAQESPLDENFLRTIRKGPYLPASPSPVRFRDSTDRKTPRVRARQGNTGAENKSPTKSPSPVTQRMVDDFLNSRKHGKDSGHGPSGSSPVFL